MVLKNRSSGEQLAPLPDNIVCCTKICYNTIVESRSGQESNRRKWETDGLGGPEDPHTSMKTLLEWMLEEGNYARFRGKNNNGVTKLQIASMLADIRQEFKAGVG
jgi:hypothetical protein